MVVEDTFLQRAMIRSILESDELNRFEVVASAHNGLDAIEKLKRQKDEIDIITLDIEMPIMDGLEALKQIMNLEPKPVIMFSSLTKNGAKETIKALSLGAIDFITKPESGEVKNVRKELIEKAYYASTVKKSVYSKFKIEEKKKITPDTNISFPKKTPIKTSSKLSNLILIGCSTGGPRSLVTIMSKLPKDLDAGIVIVQHMQVGFTSSFANSLNQVSPFEVKEAENGDEITDGKIFVAPAGLQTEIFIRGGKYHVVTSDKHLEYRHRPSVDVLFSSVARLNHNMHTFGVVLTGMGDDGTKGCQALKRIPSTVIAESEKTAILYGMPKQVKNKGLADYVEDLEEVIPRIQKIIKSTK